MNNTSNFKYSQVCETMKVFSMAQGGFLQDHRELFRPERLNEITRLGSALWAQLLAAEEEAKALEAQLSDPSFVAFKEKLLKRPRRQRKANGAPA